MAVFGAADAHKEIGEDGRIFAVVDVAPRPPDFDERFASVGVDEHGGEADAAHIGKADGAIGVLRRRREGGIAHAEDDGI